MTERQSGHRPVLLEAALSALRVKPDGVYVDATFGRGGHSSAILEQLGAQGRIVAFDQDPDAQRVAREMASRDSRFQFVRCSFADMAKILPTLGVSAVDGVLFDLGVSSPQFDEAERGFSFSHAGPLDMRMNPDSGRPLSAWLAEASHGEIASVIKRFGEEPMAGRIAAAIIAARDAGQLVDTAALAEIIRGAIPARVAAGKRIHPATRTFQAFRIYINDEMNALDAGLWGALRILRAGGRMAAISFHSLEDRRVKRFLRHQARPPKPALPMVPETSAALRLVGKPVVASESEVRENRRARSARMRVAERTAAAEVAP